jgi:excisionase family DNA binding protein
MPDKLLTTREIVDLLQLDRVTIYKMLKDGTLPALRVGGQWRFSAEAIDSWLKGQRGEPPAEPVVRPEAPESPLGLELTDLLPIATLQTIQNQFAALLKVASFITDLDGQPISPCNRCSQFCREVHATEEGMEACKESWRTIANLDEIGAATIHTCHAGVQYASAPICVNGQRMGLVTAGQFLTVPSDPAEFRARALETGLRLGVNGEKLAASQDSIEIIDAERAVQISGLLATIANTMSSIAYQSYQARQTLAQIAQLTAAAQAAEARQ